ncbi:MAG: 3'-5' exonuclease, partial [Oscillospiraceae bacterium]
LRLKRIINEPSRKIGATTIDTAVAIAQDENVSILDVVKNAKNYVKLTRAVGALDGFVEIYEKLCVAHNELPLDEFAEKVVEYSGYNAMLTALGEEGKTRLENIGQLISSVKTYVNENGEAATLEGFLEDVALISDLDSYDENTDVVVMMTLHSAKGLEFDNVFIVGMEDGIFPSEMCRYNPEDLEEERRLCYVGITRAKKRLMLSSASSRMMFGQTKRNSQSRFIKEIDPEFIEFEQSEASEYSTRVRKMHAEYLQNNPVVKPVYSSVSTISAGIANSTSTSRDNQDCYKVAASVKKFGPGDRVHHMTYGDGEVVRITPIAGDTLIEIKFDNQPTNKKVMGNYAKLTEI